jgi:hypothetical protein
MRYELTLFSCIHHISCSHNGTDALVYKAPQTLEHLQAKGANVTAILTGLIAATQFALNIRFSAYIGAFTIGDRLSHV